MEKSRIVRLSDLASREERPNRCTYVGGVPFARLRPSVRSLFTAHHRAIATALLAQDRLGASVFALTCKGVHGHLWLAATEQMRAGSIGRHASVDLVVLGDRMLSLRHCLVMVRRLDDGLRLHVVDLGSSEGLRAQELGAVGALDCDGHLLLEIPGGALGIFPTGVPLPWNPDSPQPFSTLAPRRVSNCLEPSRRRDAEDWRGEHEATMVRRSSPVELASERLCLPDEAPAGRLVLASQAGRQRLLVGLSALDRGVVLGRYPRCAGHRALDESTVSRVHALLIRREGTVFLVDAGSANGTWSGDQEVKCAAITGGGEFRLGPRVTLAWEPLD